MLQQHIRRALAGASPTSNACFLGYLNIYHNRSLFYFLPDWYSEKGTEMKRAPSSCRTQGSGIKWRRPTLPRVCSTIGATVLNFSVRNGKRWNHSAITTGNILLDILSLQVSSPCHAQGVHPTINLHEKENTVSSNPAPWNHHVSTLADKLSAAEERCSGVKFRAISSARL